MIEVCLLGGGGGGGAEDGIFLEQLGFTYSSLCTFKTGNG